ncbi:hypothetical protein M407DRAFT_7334 [Tulasnella calospora MUT 4182]|uniref:Uncharacterized protein n=1 Tax=Tulasnella calospora MUT 4182 TaxID=1051891 RepID=A0A0C3QLB6_9AGAM|nr:hypothetical protein M407DRAFT_7334 [Tulasnella calospora MUT 4182]
MVSYTGLDISAGVNTLLDLAKASGVLKGRVHKDADIAAVVSSVNDYSRTVWIFVNGKPVDHLRYGDEVEIRLARDGIAAWHFQLEQALQLIKEAGLHERNPSFFQRVQRRKAIRRCINEINSAHERFEVGPTTLDSNGFD